MTKDTPVRPSIVKQILDEMFTALEGMDEFDTYTIKRLKELAERGELDKVKKVEEAVKSPSEGAL